LLLTGTSNVVGCHEGTLDRDRLDELCDAGEATSGLLDVWKIVSGESASSKLTFVHHCALSTTYHHGHITHLEASDAFSIFVSVCSKTNAVLLWDLNTCSLVTVLTILPAPCTSVRIDGRSGDILVTAGFHIYQFDANGRQIAHLDIRARKPTHLAEISTAHMVTVPHPSTEGQLIMTGHIDGTVHIFQLAFNPPSGSDGSGGYYSLMLHHSLRAFDDKTPVTAIACNSSVSRVYIGAHDGSLRCWRRFG
jgi:WD40 repeat protein